MPASARKTRKYIVKQARACDAAAEPGPVCWRSDRNSVSPPLAREQMPIAARMRMRIVSAPPMPPDPSRADSRPAFGVMTKPIESLCNLDCDYCYYLEKARLYPGASNPRMLPETLERYVRDYIAAQPGPTVSFAWQGGEPTLLGVDFFREAVALQRRHAGGKRIENALQTNGTPFNYPQICCQSIAEGEISEPGEATPHDDVAWHGIAGAGQVAAEPGNPDQIRAQGWSSLGFRLLREQPIKQI